MLIFVLLSNISFIFILTSFPGLVNLKIRLNILQIRESKKQLPSSWILEYAGYADLTTQKFN